ncbi:hypothetical protein COCMIDRAFT_99285 [Bipolaris oryzae ATCC 44560]|uniref:Uncharacterized protein n=1 Tax=Bipolaris oryzae ATCC 44560 TaxID=930090 RepID=W6Z215_COCMI|nr:uncharacterized protein COCMIDRAFT_99285 [Bipolaris oryzae ATCC 44560]EUC44035.1 hypothetical protein COCMIDRAFT_99285 [Bipolaris oryzae ATCC 44560]
MSEAYKNTSLNEIAHKAEQDVNSHAAKHGHVYGDSTIESGIDSATVETKFPGATATYGSAASGAGNNRDIPPEEGGDVRRGGEVTKARDFAQGGVGAPERRDETFARTHGGDDSVRDNIRN